MKHSQRPWKWLFALLLGLIVLPLISLGLGILWVTPLRVTRTPHSRDESSVEAGAAEPTSSIPPEAPPPAQFALNPQNRIHLFLVMPLLAGLTVLLVSGLGGIIWWTWLRPPASETNAYGDDAEHDGGRTNQITLLILLLWAALSILFIFDLLGAASLYPVFVAVYAGFWTLVGALLLYDRPLREKGLALVLFLIVVVSLGFVNWNSRKPFLRDLYRIDEGMIYPQVERLMNGYERSLGNDTRVDEQGQPVTGNVAYTHTDAAWGNSNVGLVTFENGRVTEIQYLPD
jgi:hypothetical protein